SLAIATLAYAQGWRRMRGRALGTVEALCFAAGILSLILALQSPLDSLGGDLFSAHMAQHLMLMLVAAPLVVCARPLLPFFWAVLIETSRPRRLDYASTLLFVATAAVLSGLPGALMALSPRPFYPIHAEGAARWELSLIEDQQLAGLIMWIPAGFAYMAAIL